MRASTERVKSMISFYLTVLLRLKTMIKEKIIIKYWKKILALIQNDQN
jgi:hypothetical protein